MLKKLGPYLLKEVIGRGGMGTVYRAHHEESGEVCAVKALSPVLAHDEHFRNRFSSEIEALLKLDHPNIVRLIGYGQDEGNLFFAMELVEGKSLFQIQRDGHRFDWREIIQITRDICQGLRHAHDRGVIHRDLKPGNLLKPEDGPYKITDFGIAKRFGASQNTGENVIGTMDFMSPEQAQGRPVTVRSDLYSLGTVMYTLLSGKPPFVSNSIEESLRNVTEVKPPSITVVNPNVPRELDQLISKLMSKEPENRVPTALALLTRLDELEQKLRHHAEAKTAEGIEPSPRSDSGPDPAASSTRQHGDLVTAAVGNLKTGQATTENEFTLEPPPESAPAEDYFQPVARHRRPIAEETRDRQTSNRGSVIWLAISLVAVLAVTFYGVYRALQPPSATELYEAIVSSPNPEKEREEIAQFLQYYSADPRVDEVRVIDEYARSVALRNRLVTVYNTTGNLSAIQKQFVEIVLIAGDDPISAHSKMAAFKTMHGGAPSLSDEDQECVRAASSYLAKIEDDARRDENEQRLMIKQTMDRAADPSLDDEKARELYRSVINLYSRFEWASDYIAQAKRELRKRVDR